MNSSFHSTCLRMALAVTVLIPCATLVVGCGSSSSSSSSAATGTVVNNVVMTPVSGAVLADAVHNRFFQQRFSVASGGLPPYSYGEVSNGLPAGLFVATTLSTSSGQAVIENGFTDVIGFPQAVGTDTVEFRVFDSNLDITDLSYGLTTTAGPSGLSLSPASGSTLTTGTVGSAYPTVTVTIGNGTPDYTWGIPYGALPDGLTLTANPTGSNSAVAEISGTPSAPGTWLFAIQASDAASTAGNGGAVYQITIQ